MDGNARKKQKVVLIVIGTQNYAEGVILAERKEQHSFEFETQGRNSSLNICL